ncbi:cation diffusion facilitator family transporter [Flaviflagellibacter deserti]|jgi:cation diffusion facilitator family transporter|uniref:Cation diffusion facilitator family transporter n=1 Tax=Flaviflagellibacter deserti TaxID=2267266 RepID=A0ABV9YY04_9HYPH
MSSNPLLFRIAFGSIAVSLIVLGLKLLAFWMTGSVALYSDALESIINVVTAFAALGALWFSYQPADQNHPYGHHKAEYLSAVLEGVLIVLAAISILHQAYLGFLDPRPLNAPWQGLTVNLVATTINAFWALLLIRTGRKHRSPALTADGGHLMTDVVTSAGVFVGLVGAIVFDMPLLDPILAGFVAINIIWMGWKLMRESVGGLMDEAVPPVTLDAIKSIIATEAEGAIEAHDIRTRQAGRATFVDFHLVVAGDMTVSFAHDICDRIERALKGKIEDITVTIHVEPEDKAKHQGIVVL